MKIDDNLLEERIGIANMHFCAPLELTELNQIDLCLHKSDIKKVYKGMLREACVIDDCCRRFKRMFRYGWN